MQKALATTVIIGALSLLLTFAAQAFPMSTTPASNAVSPITSVRDGCGSGKFWNELRKRCELQRPRRQEVEEEDDEEEDDGSAAAAAAINSFIHGFRENQRGGERRRER